MDRRVQNFIFECLEASIYVSPNDHGLTFDELNTIGEPFDIRPGELRDRLHGLSHEEVDQEGSRFRLARAQWPWLHGFDQVLDPEHRNPDAFEFVLEGFENLIREHGRREGAATSRASVRAQAAASGVPEHDLDIALAILDLMGVLKVEGDVVRRLRDWAKPSTQRRHVSARDREQRQWMGQVHGPVEDAIERRSDGRVSVPEPRRAFADVLAKLGHDRFKMWWLQTNAELDRADPLLAPTMSLVLAAAVCEGALAFIVKHGKTLGTMKVPDDPTQWGFPALVKSAKSGPNQVAVLDQKLADRVEELNRARQRIHVGRLLAENPTGPIPDANPERGREAKATADALVRRILEWLETNPAT